MDDHGIGLDSYSKKRGGALSAGNMRSDQVRQSWGGVIFRAYLGLTGLLAIGVAVWAALANLENLDKFGVALLEASGPLDKAALLFFTVVRFAMFGAIIWAGWRYIVRPLPPGAWWIMAFGTLCAYIAGINAVSPSDIG